jgi:hypothetical protein
VWIDRLIKWLSGNSTIGSFEDESEACMVQSQLAPSINQVRELLLWSNPTFRLFSVPESVLPLNGMFANPHYRSVNSCTAPLFEELSVVGNLQMQKLVNNNVILKSGRRSE